MAEQRLRGGELVKTGIRFGSALTLPRLYALIL
jgi:hypothetical protein